MSMLMAVSIVIGILLLIYAVVYFESAQRKVPVHYAKRQFGSGMMPGQSIHMPFKLNMAGVIPPIFASSIILFPSTLLGWFGSNSTNSVLHKVAVDAATWTAFVYCIICHNYHLLLLFLYCFSI